MISLYEKIETARHIDRVVAKLIGENSSQVLYKAVCEDLENQIKREYGLKTMDEFTERYLADLHDFLDCYTLPRYLEEICDCYRALIK